MTNKSADATGSSSVSIVSLHLLIALPGDSSRGITKGEIPIDPTLSYDQVPKAANLTTNGDRACQLSVWAGGHLDKAKVRLTVEIPAAELISFRQLRDRFAIRTKWVKLLAPYHERKHWFYAFSGVKPEQIVAVELWDGTAYTAINGANLATLVTEIEAEKERAFEAIVFAKGRLKGAGGLRFRKGVMDSWLADGASRPNRALTTLMRQCSE